MKTLFNLCLLLAVLLTACEKDTDNTIKQGDFPVKEYYLERDPNVNVWGAGMDFIHSECSLEVTTLDYEYLEDGSTFPFDVKFHTVKAYYVDGNGDTKSEGCPAMLLGTDVSACKLGAGVAFFDSLMVITEDMLAQLETEPEVDYEACKNSSGKYDQDLLFAAIDQCIIGRSFRSNVLVIPAGKTESEAQPVYLIKTSEGGYAKFMVKKFQGDAPNEKKTLVRWQVISE
jgi:hypothetical protein